MCARAHTIAFKIRTALVGAFQRLNLDHGVCIVRAVTH